MGFNRFLATCACLRLARKEGTNRIADNRTKIGAALLRCKSIKVLRVVDVAAFEQHRRQIGRFQNGEGRRLFAAVTERQAALTFTKDQTGEFLGPGLRFALGQIDQDCADRIALFIDPHAVN